MRVDSIQLQNFRNYSTAQVDFGPGINIISGKNAQGKTNLLEAVYLLTGGKSFRTRYDRELIAFDSDFARIYAQINAAERNQTIDITLRRGQRRKILKNGVKKTAAELSDTLTAVIFCPDDLYIIKDRAHARRRLMDMAIAQMRPGYEAILSEFNRLYEHKSRILKDWREKPSLLDMLEDFNRKMCICSARLIRYRASFAARLMNAAVPIHHEFSGGREDISITYTTMSTVTDPLAPLVDLVEEISLHQADHFRAELESGLCLTGVHKDDLNIKIGGISARNFASQGQVRTAALSIKLAERDIFLEETGEYPVLLLDDVLSELDADRQEFVLNRVGGGQTLISCCEDNDIAKRTGGRIIMVENGKIRYG
ncbi:MAG TPA: DNA replication/repair protein RecF [Clostridiales bacterium]|nr:DNA replication/repair protein RecF [Clostridiales bacterium]